jgi:hypothetical protein
MVCFGRFEEDKRRRAVAGRMLSIKFPELNARGISSNIQNS